MRRTAAFIAGFSAIVVLAPPLAYAAVAAGLTIQLVDDAPGPLERYDTPVLFNGLTLWLKPTQRITGEMLASASNTKDSNGAPAVELRLNLNGRDALALMTTKNIGRRIAFMVDGAVIAAPIIEAPITDGAALLPCCAAAAEADELVSAMMRAVPRTRPLP